MQLSVTDFKQFVYCPRVIYYNYVEPVPRKVSYKMQYARQQHDQLNQKEKRRSFGRYNLIAGKRYFGYPVHSERLDFYGKLDMLIDTKTKNGQRYFPVECKDTDGKINNNIKYQLAAYAMALEEVTGTSVTTGYIYIIPEDKAYPIEVTENERDYVRKMVTMINNIVEQEHFPEPRSRKRCWDCEFKRYCNDLDLPSGTEQKEQDIEKMQALFGNKFE